VAAWLNSIGATGIILKYRVPRRPDEVKGEPARRPLQDAQRTVSLVRSNASRWGIHPQQIGMVGFSAGGHHGRRRVPTGCGIRASSSRPHNPSRPEDSSPKPSVRSFLASPIRGASNVLPNIRNGKPPPSGYRTNPEQRNSQIPTLGHSSVTRCGRPPTSTRRPPGKRLPDREGA